MESDESVMFENFLARITHGPIFVRSAVEVHQREHEHVLDDLMQRCYPRIDVVNALARYPTRLEWRRRWPDEYHRYGGGVFVTAPDWHPGPGERLLLPDWGMHLIGQTMLNEITDFVAAKCPVVWYALLRQGRTFIAHFSIERVLWIHPTYRVAQLAPNPQAEIFKPDVSDNVLQSGDFFPLSKAS